MKRAVCAFCALLLLWTLSACAGEDPASDVPFLTASPLIRTVAPAGATRLLPTAEGFLVLWEREDGFAASFLSPEKSELVEESFTGGSSPAGAAFLETEPGKGLLAAGGSAWYVLLDRKGAEERALGEDIVFCGAFFRDEGLICRKGTLLLLVTADLSRTLVLADTARLPDFGFPLFVTRDGRRLWYARQKDGAFLGVGAFTVGEDRAAETLDLSFDGICAAGERLFLLRKNGDGAVLTRLDPETKEADALTLPFSPAKFALSPDGSRAAFWDEAAGLIRLYDRATGRELGRKDVSRWGQVSDLAFRSDGATLCAALRRDDGEILLSLA
ncbi:MAG: hypothetical protein II776_08065 [Clostridia bacterium]|nr:hypothetical protein [Clostridia bacterium]